MVKRLLLTTVFLLSLTLSLFAQRTTDKLDRGLVAVPGSSGGTLESWRIFDCSHISIFLYVYMSFGISRRPSRPSCWRYFSNSASLHLTKWPGVISRNDGLSVE